LATEIKLETAGSVWKVLVSEGEAVKAGQTLFILEVMKMEVTYDAPADGKVVALRVSEGDVVEENQLAAVLE